MTWTMRSTQAALLAATLAGTLLSLTHISAAAAQTSPAAQADTPSASDAEVRLKLNKKQFRNVKVSVEQSTAILTGTVDIFAYKADAEKRAGKVKGIAVVRNQIEVAGVSVPDDLLRAQILEKLSADRPGYTNNSKSITVSVKSGVVTLAGSVGTEVDRDMALGMVSNCPGVKDMVNRIAVASPGAIHNLTISGQLSNQ